MIKSANEIESHLSDFDSTYCIDSNMHDIDQYATLK